VPSFIQKVVETYEDQRCHSAGPGSSSTDIDASAQGDEISTTGGKQAANLLLLLTSMYNLQLISCVLVFDLVRELIQGRDETPEQQMLKEEDVELILIIARCTYEPYEVCTRKKLNG
jgi:nucleolar MIF4G domain-containing protein 1